MAVSIVLQRAIKIKLGILLGALLVIPTSINVVGLYLYLPGPLQDSKNLIIEPGLSIQKISLKLAERGIITHPVLFEIIGKFYSLSLPLKSGEYKFTTNITPFQILRKLGLGKSIIHKLLIPEGYMVSEILELLNQEELLTGKIIEDIPEGYLMPSTYYYSYGDKRQKIIDKMRYKMSKTLDEIMLKLPSNSPVKTRMEVLILASIIEKEAGNDPERPAVAAVFLNRLKKGMKLQADPTSAYAITEGKYKLNRPLTKKDLKIESPYNTYYISGLPIGPISCPGRKSFEAIVNPAKIDSLYFVVDGKGGHRFSATLKDHNDNVQLFRQSQKKTVQEVKK
jgi:UPF0755 protein